MSTVPARGDVLIVSKDGRHFVSVVPHRADISFKSLSAAREFAGRWVRTHNRASIWRQNNGEMHLMALADVPVSAASNDAPELFRIKAAAPRSKKTA
jgi:hypothetical protein